MRVAVVGPSRWALQGVASALAAPAHDAIEPAWALELHEAWPAGSAAADDIAACVALADDAAALQALLDTLPRALPLLVLCESPPALLPLLEAEKRALGLLSANVSDQRLRAALAALLQGLSVFDPALRPSAPLSSRAEAAEPIEPLTPRELEVYELLAKGLSNRDIAAVLEISAHTAKYHVAQILDKTGTATRAEAVSLGLRLGLIGF